MDCQSTLLLLEQPLEHHLKFGFLYDQSIVCSIRNLIRCRHRMEGIRSSIDCISLITSGLTQPHMSPVHLISTRGCRKYLTWPSGPCVSFGPIGPLSSVAFRTFWTYLGLCSMWTLYSCPIVSVIFSIIFIM